MTVGVPVHGIAPDVDAAYRHCAKVVRASGSSFAATFWMLSRPQRRALHAVYAFCRLADDIADDPSIRGDRALLLARWRDELAAAYAGRPGHPIGVALADAVARYALPQSWFDDLLEGVETDLSGRRFERYAEVERYCYGVAVTVGLMVVGVLGARDEATERFAYEMGIAVQLTNILRDVGDDARSCRLYLAMEDLDRHGVTRAMIESGRPSPALHALLAEYAARARGHFDRARILMPPDRARVLRPARAMGAIYRELLRTLEARGFASLETPVRLSKARRLGIAARVFVTPGLAT